VLSVWLAGEREAIGVTGLHPFWSADRGGWVPAGSLQEGERVQGLDGPVRVQRVEERGDEPVYNLEVDADHCYRVGEQGILVHNSSVYYRGGESGPRGLLSPLARADGILAAAQEFGKAKAEGDVDNWFAQHAEESDDLEDLNPSPFVSVTKSCQVAYYFATHNGSGSVFTLSLEDGKRVRKNRHNTKWVVVAGRRYAEREYLVPVRIRSSEVDGEEEY
jgi:hypothetical protein